MKTKSKRYTVKFRRRKEGRTNYKKRLSLLISKKPRLVIRKSANNIVASIVEYDSKGDKVMVSSYSKELKNLGWKYSTSNMPAAYLTGLNLGKKAKEKGINKVILDIGLFPSIKGTKIYSVLSGVIDGGIDVPHDESILPSEERIKGKHIVDYANKIKGNNEIFQKQFGEHVKNNVDPLAIEKSVEDIKKKIIGG